MKNLILTTSLIMTLITSQSVFSQTKRTPASAGRAEYIDNCDTYSSYIEVLYLASGAKIKVDFDIYCTSGPTLFLIISSCEPSLSSF